VDLSGVRIEIGVAVTVMNPVVCCPPKSSFLSARLRAEREDCLERAGRFVGSMREVTMVAGCYEEHSSYIKGNAHNPVKASDVGEEGKEGNKVQRDEESLVYLAVG
jgi:hypothetical protein